MNNILLLPVTEFTYQYGETNIFKNLYSTFAHIPFEYETMVKAKELLDTVPGLEFIGLSTENFVKFTDNNSNTVELELSEYFVEVLVYTDKVIVMLSTDTEEYYATITIDEAAIFSTRYPS